MQSRLSSILNNFEFECLKLSFLAVYNNIWVRDNDFEFEYFNLLFFKQQAVISEFES
jgi:hypothetical protein